jgi:hypothetical protein
MIKGVIHAHLGPIWYYSEPSDIPNSPNPYLGWEFFCRLLQQGGSSSCSKLFHFFFITYKKKYTATSIVYVVAEKINLH